MTADLGGVIVAIGTKTGFRWAGRKEVPNCRVFRRPHLLHAASPNLGRPRGEYARTCDVCCSEGVPLSCVFAHSPRTALPARPVSSYYSLSCLHADGRVAKRSSCRSPGKAGHQAPFPPFDFGPPQSFDEFARCRSVPDRNPCRSHFQSMGHRLPPCQRSPYCHRDCPGAIGLIDST